MNLHWGKIIASALALWAGALLFISSVGARERAISETQAWMRVPVRSAAQLEDIAPGTQIVQVVGIIQANSPTERLAVFSIEQRECRWVTETDSDGNSTRKRKCSWREKAAWSGGDLQVATADVARYPLTIASGYAYGGPMRYEDLPDHFGDQRRAVGWRSGDALIVVGRAGSEPGQVIDASVTSQSLEEWRGGMWVGPSFWTIWLWIVGLGTIGGTLAIWFIDWEEV